MMIDTFKNSQLVLHHLYSEFVVNGEGSASHRHFDGDGHIYGVLGSGRAREGYKLLSSLSRLLYR
jgi:hypothetical protein